MPPGQSNPFPNPLKLGGVVLWLFGGFGFCAAWAVLNRHLVNVVTYETVEVGAPATIGSYLPLWGALAYAALLFAARRRPAYAPRDPIAPQPDGRTLGLSALKAGVPLLGIVAIATLYWAGPSAGFVTACVIAVCAGWAIERLGRGVNLPRWTVWIDRFAPTILVVSIVSSTVWHTAEQVNFWRHFMLGYSDIGFFTTELEHCLPWKDVPERFVDTRMGYHCEFLFYALAPFYALFRSPVFLMFVGPLALNLAAIAFYSLGKERSRSSTIGLLMALSWLLLPSVSRLPYANTYGFESVYLAVPFVAFALSLAMRGRWVRSHVCLGLAILCQETVCGVAFGWGLYLFVFQRSRRTGLAVAVISLSYLVLCALVIIPCFAASSSLVRLEVFGELTLTGAWDRLTRPRVVLYLIALASPMIPGLVHGRRLLIAAAPTLCLVLLMQNPDWLNIKYWHQSTFLPVLFAAAVMGATRPVSSVRPSEDRLPSSLGPALGLFVTCLLLHQVLGFSPLAQAHRPYAFNVPLQTPDPRLDMVAFVRSHYPPATTTIVATERMAAHFCDYRMVYPASWLMRFPDEPPCDVLIVDRNDRWDGLVRAGRAHDLISQAEKRGYSLIRERSGVILLERQHP